MFVCNFLLCRCQRWLILIYGLNCWVIMICRYQPCFPDKTLLSMFIAEKLCFINVSDRVYEWHHKPSRYDFMSREHVMLCGGLVNEPS
jgi:hypothetical protein